MAATKEFTVTPAGTLVASNAGDVLVSVNSQMAVTWAIGGIARLIAACKNFYAGAPVAQGDGM